jgi:hypothetical protein
MIMRPSTAASLSARWNEKAARARTRIKTARLRPDYSGRFTPHRLFREHVTNQRSGLS